MRKIGLRCRWFIVLGLLAGIGTLGMTPEAGAFQENTDEFHVIFPTENTEESIQEQIFLANILGDIDVADEDGVIFIPSSSSTNNPVASFSVAMSAVQRIPGDGIRLRMVKDSGAVHWSNVIELPEDFQTRAFYELTLRKEYFTDVTPPSRSIRLLNELFPQVEELEQENATNAANFTWAQGAIINLRQKTRRQQERIRALETVTSSGRWADGDPTDTRTD